MSIKHRIKALEKEYRLNMGSEPWLTFDIDVEPTPAQLAAMKEAESKGRTYICFIMPSDTIYVSLARNPPPWQHLVEYQQNKESI